MSEQKIAFHLNGAECTVTAPADMPLLWVLRERLALTGTKFGCGKGLCGACTVLLDGTPVRTCVLPVAAVSKRDVLTIEGLARGEQLHPVQQAWLDLDVPQCGYCQSGQILNAVALLRGNPKPDENEIRTAMSPVICRCGAYRAIDEAIHLAAERGAGAEV
jgi:isoquinoline 1-oxidoreductase subunit alpha